MTEKLLGMIVQETPEEDKDDEAATNAQQPTSQSHRRNKQIREANNEVSDPLPCPFVVDDDVNMSNMPWHQTQSTFRPSAWYGPGEFGYNATGEGNSSAPADTTTPGDKRKAILQAIMDEIEEFI